MSDHRAPAVNVPPTPGQHAHAQQDAAAHELVPGSEPSAEQTSAAAAQTAEDGEQQAVNVDRPSTRVGTGWDDDPRGEDIEVECPGCGLILVAQDKPRPSAEWFCPKCDYPVFWASPADDEVLPSDRARRRLPGAAGRQTLGAGPCWNCAEMNQPDATLCVRCAATLPKPQPPEPEPVFVDVEVPIPVPSVVGQVTWPFVTGAALGAAALAVSVTLWILHAAGVL